MSPYVFAGSKVFTVWPTVAKNKCCFPQSSNLLLRFQKYSYQEAVKNKLPDYLALVIKFKT